MNKASGIMTSEIATAIIGLLVCSGIGFGWYVSAQRDGMVAKAMDSLEALEAQAVLLKAEEMPPRCDDGMLDNGLFANDYIDLKIRPIPLDGSDPDAGYGPGFYIESEREADGEDAFVSSERLYKAVKAKSEGRLRWVTEEEDEIRFSILASDEVRCAILEGQPTPAGEELASPESEATLKAGQISAP